MCFKMREDNYMDFNNSKSEDKLPEVETSTDSTDVMSDFLEK